MHERLTVEKALQVLWKTPRDTCALLNGTLWFFMFLHFLRGTIWTRYVSHMLLAAVGPSYLVEQAPPATTTAYPLGERSPGEAFIDDLPFLTPARNRDGYHSVPPR